MSLKADGKMPLLKATDYLIPFVLKWKLWELLKRRKKTVAVEECNRYRYRYRFTPAFIGYAFHDLPLLSSAFLTCSTYFSVMMAWQGGNWWECWNNRYEVKGQKKGKESLIKLQKNIKNSPVYYSTLVRFSRLSSCTRTKFLDLHTDPSKAWNMFFGSPHQGVWKAQTPCRCSSSTFYNRNHLLLKPKGHK